MKKIRIAQIGASETTHAAQVFESLVRQKDIFDVVGFADVDRHSGGLNPVFAGHRRMSAEDILSRGDIDAVAVECDEVLQTRYALMTAERGLPMHLEKPGSESDADFDRLIDLVEAKNLLLHTGYMYRYNPAVQRAAELIRAGRLGEIYSVEAQMNCCHGDAMRQWFSTFRGGMMFYLGCHLVDLIYGLQGEPLSVEALSTSVAPEQYPGRDFGMALFKYPHGVSFAKTCGAEPGGFLRRQLVICGTEGTIEIKPLERDVGGGLQTTEMTETYRAGSTWHTPGTHTTFAPYNRYDGMMSSFAAMVRGEKANPVPPAYERGLHKLILKACGF